MINIEAFMGWTHEGTLQESISGSWHIPQKAGDSIETPQEWLCVTRSATETCYSEPNTKLELATKTKEKIWGTGSCD
jgi:hypothetical protein